ncbi:hypothetical protein BO86DRAFT_381580 [Aspergillus japonicus CBS 114.51]|uniref:Uncharacterized protein n=1 Tax=Aspergillus japonicus CBS 114.51 TaxID=1448312 RepID=A0A8T8WUJ4_ASPJA|nr:hypothetical protein BO86DRAFT_381580 [Aspergillus japonicus CBS 114.51]RAH79132.1 hypothetical protein BO86DRAFT_381580 [Aspergillus japonicus CBS 114.51]
MVGKQSPKTNTSKAPKEATAGNPDNDRSDQLPASSLPISPIRLLPNQAPITLNEFRTWRTHPLPPAIPVFDDLSPQRIRVGLSRDLRPHRVDAHYRTSLAYEPVYLAPHTHSSTYSLLLLLQSCGDEALRADDVLLHPPFTDPRTCLFVARNSLRAWRRQWEAALLVALGRRTPTEMTALVRAEVARDKYRPWFVVDEFEAEYELCAENPVLDQAAFAD